MTVIIPKNFGSGLRLFSYLLIGTGLPYSTLLTIGELPSPHTQWLTRPGTLSQVPYVGEYGKSETNEFSEKKKGQKRISSPELNR